MDLRKRVLSIQSHVVSGYVGNKSATFPLQLLGFEVDALNTTQFSNHKGYSICKGLTLSPNHLLEIVEGLKSNDLFNYTHLLTGYLGTKENLEAIYEILKQLKEKNSKLIYVLDPVMGDAGKLYVSQDVLPLYQTLLLPLSTVITPNHFEAELLSGMKINNMLDVEMALKRLAEKGPKKIVITSLDFSSSPDKLILVGSDSMETFQIQFPKINHFFSGTGDLFAALLLAFMDEMPRLRFACERALNCMQGVLLRTACLSQGEGPKSQELKLVHCQEQILKPLFLYEAEPLFTDLK